MTELLEHVIFCDAQDTAQAAIDRTLGPEQLRARQQDARQAQAGQEAAQRRAAALSHLQLRTAVCHPEPLTTRDLADLLLALGLA